MAAYRLAHELGYVNVDGMLAQISTTQMREWVAFLQMQNEQQSKPAPRPAERPKGHVTHWRDMKGMMGTRVRMPQA